ncbi:zinc-binding dehydrogenase [Actinocrispum wychmicini]|uniref:Zinc-binding dehydrogenase n=2 Tax=Actinocrispum wychmicini TaxID=1213861 RepID=A0A4R2IL96_9PSEU|nr:zinc-binding dehydrogenase [Actinocrispum wychmicini]
MAEAQLAHQAGFTTAMAAGRDARLDLIRRHGIIPIDHRRFPDLDHDEHRYRTDPDYKDRYRASEAEFLKVIDELSNGRGVAILIDHIGGGLHKASLKALARQGVITTAGWKAGMHLRSVRASECIQRHLHVHTHVWRHQDSPAIREYQNHTGWIADDDPNAVWDYDHIPQLADAHTHGMVDSYFPLCRITNPT